MTIENSGLIDNPTLDLSPMDQMIVSIQALVMLNDTMALEKVLCVGCWHYERPKLDFGCRCLEDLQTYQLQEITGRRDFPRDLLLILARYLVQREYAVRNGQFTRYRTAEQLTASFIRAYSHKQLAPSEEYVDDSRQRVNGARSVTYRDYALPSSISVASPIHPENPFPPRGQGFLIREYLLYREEPLNPFTHYEVTDALVRNGFTCNQDPYRAIRWVLDEWVKKGFLVRR